MHFILKLQKSLYPAFKVQLSHSEQAMPCVTRYSVCWTLLRVSSPALGSLNAAWVRWTTNFTGSTSLTGCFSSWQSQFAGVWTAAHRRTCRTTAFRPPMPTLGSTCVPPTVNCLQYLATGSTLTTRTFSVCRPHSLELSPGLSGTRPSVQTFSDVCLKRTRSLDTSAFSALQVLDDNRALYIYLLTYIHVTHTLKWAVRVINKLRRRPMLLMTPRIPPPAHRRGRESPWGMNIAFFGGKASDAEIFWPVKNFNFTYPTCIWQPRWGWFHRNFVKIFCIIARSCSRDRVFSRFGRTPACDGQTDGRTDAFTTH